ncbi:MAG: helix-turn-helix transcriptional regulator [Clostridia bacterium]|nr:helix-turn-helix transcriptional regulator [Clostridia bacterium]
MCVSSVFPVIDLPGTGRNIQRLREKAGVTVRELQAYFGFEYPQAIYKWQHGECLPSIDNLLALARVLEVPMEDLLVYDDREVSYFWQALEGFAAA